MARDNRERERVMNGMVRVRNRVGSMGCCMATMMDKGNRKLTDIR